MVLEALEDASSEVLGKQVVQHQVESPAEALDKILELKGIYYLKLGASASEKGLKFTQKYLDQSAQKLEQICKGVFNGVRYRPLAFRNLILAAWQYTRALGDVPRTSFLEEVYQQTNKFID